MPVERKSASRARRASLRSSCPSTHVDPDELQRRPANDDRRPSGTLAARCASGAARAPDGVRRLRSRMEHRERARFNADEPACQIRSTASLRSRLRRAVTLPAVARPSRQERWFPVVLAAALAATTVVLASKLWPMRAARVTIDDRPRGDQRPPSHHVQRSTRWRSPRRHSPGQAHGSPERWSSLRSVSFFGRDDFPLAGGRSLTSSIAGCAFLTSDAFTRSRSSCFHRKLRWPRSRGPWASSSQRRTDAAGSNVLLWQKGGLGYASYPMSRCPTRRARDQGGIRKTSSIARAARTCAANRAEKSRTARAAVIRALNRKRGCSHVQAEPQGWMKLVGVGGVRVRVQPWWAVAVGARATGPATARDGKTRRSHERLMFLQLSDTHWGSKRGQSKSDRTLPSTVQTINGVELQPDFIVFTGDLTHKTDDPAERRRRMGEFKQIVGASR